MELLLSSYLLEHFHYCHVNYWIVAKCFQLRVGFATDWLDLLGGFVSSLLCKLHEIG